MSSLTGNPLARRFGDDSGRQDERPVPAPTTSRETTATRRSWYLPKNAADELARVVDDLHYATRRPKHEVLGAIVAVALEHRDEIDQRLT